MAGKSNMVSTSPPDVDVKVLAKVQQDVEDLLFEKTFGENSLLVVFANGQHAYNVKGRELLDRLSQEMQNDNFPVKMHYLGNGNKISKKRAKKLLALLDERLRLKEANAIMVFFIKNLKAGKKSVKGQDQITCPFLFKNDKIRDEKKLLSTLSF